MSLPQCEEAAPSPLVARTPRTSDVLAAPPAALVHMIWFRKGLRVHDNAALLAARDAAAAAAAPLLAIFVLDP
eukprot:272128-Prymnesium_polylepis.1